MAGCRLRSRRADRCTVSEPMFANPPSSIALTSASDSVDAHQPERARAVESTLRPMKSIPWFRGDIPLARRAACKASLVTGLAASGSVSSNPPRDAQSRSSPAGGWGPRASSRPPATMSATPGVCRLGLKAAPTSAATTTAIDSERARQRAERARRHRPVSRKTTGARTDQPYVDQRFDVHVVKIRQIYCGRKPRNRYPRNSRTRSVAAVPTLRAASRQVVVRPVSVDTDCRACPRRRYSKSRLWMAGIARTHCDRRQGTAAAIFITRREP